MISEKMKELVKGSSVIRAMFEEGKKMSAIYGAENVYDFSLGNPNIEAPECVNEAIKEILEKEKSTFVHGYMSNSGYEDVRLSVAASINRRFDTKFSEENIIMTVGAAGGLNVILKTLLNPGDEVIVFAPFFGEYRSYVSNYDGKLVVISADIPNFQLNLNELKEKISAKTKAVIINNPNNPTGVVYSENTIISLCKILEEKQQELQSEIYLISDEPYRELAYDDCKVCYLTKYYSNTIVGYSYSKSLSLPGERIGYIVLPDELSYSEEIKAAANVATRILGFVNAPSLMQRVIGKCVDEEIDITPYNKNREFLYNNLTRLGFQCIKPQGAFYLFVKSPVEDEKIFVEAAKKQHILLVPGSAFSCLGYVRIAYCVSYETIVNSINAFEKLAKEIM